jgi:hypothetical protein
MASVERSGRVVRHRLTPSTFVEDQVDHVKNGVEPAGEILVTAPDTEFLRRGSWLCAHDTLRERRRRRQERVQSAPFEPAHLAKRGGNARRLQRDGST